MGQADEQNLYYLSTPRPEPHAPLTGEQVFDVCIVGGGISGLSAALHLAERGMRVALLEARHLGYGGFRPQRRAIHLRLRLRDVDAGEGRGRR
jgi:NADPH-dependent 2,4-dienoyl-CoA reductase/sulfur reductase-like enzyme